MAPYMLFGYNIIIQNVYPFEITLLDPFKQVESWIFVHGWVPMHVRTLVDTIWIAWLICYIWESYECSWFLVRMTAGLFGPNVVYNFAAWLGGELPSDSLIGDVGQGLLCSLWASYFLRASGVPSGMLWHARSIPQKLWRLFVLFLISHSAVISTILLVRDLNEPLYYSSLWEWMYTPMNLIPLGWYIWIVLQVFLTLYVRWEDYTTFPEYEYEIKQYYNCLFIYFTVEALLCSTFWIPTYLTYWVGQPILIIIFYFYFHSTNYHITPLTAWEMFKETVHGIFEQVPKVKQE